MPKNRVYRSPVLRKGRIISEHSNSIGWSAALGIYDLNVVCRGTRQA